jgi:IS66 Orf2 like protein
MFLLSPHTKVFLAKEPTDMRKGFQGLFSLAESVMEQDPLSGHVFVFINRSRDMLKSLHWDGCGFWIWYRQLERGTHQLPPPILFDFRRERIRACYVEVRRGPCSLAGPERSRPRHGKETDCPSEDAC